MWHKWISLVIVPVILTALIQINITNAESPPENEASVLRDYYSANGLLNRGLYELAATDYENFLTAHGKHEKAPVARYGLGVALYRLNRHGEAHGVLLPLLDHPRFEYEPEVSLILGRCRVAAGKHADAADHFRRILDRHPDHELADDAACFLAEALYDSGSFERVAAPCATLIERWPDSPRRERAELFRGLAAMALKRYEEAAENFTALLKQFPRGVHHDQSSLLLARCLHRSGALDQAARRYQKVIEQTEVRFIPDALYGLARLLYDRDRLDDAGDLLQGLLNRYAKHEIQAPARLLLGRILFRQNDDERALEQFEKLSQLDPEYQDDAAYWSAKCEFHQKRYERAERRLAAAAEEYLDSELLAEIIYDRAVALLRLEWDENAIEILRLFRSQFPQHDLAADALHLTASTQHRLENYADSRQSCVVFVDQFPEHRLLPAMRFLAAENEYLAERYEHAAEQYRQFLEEYDDNENAPAARYRLGMALHRLDRFTEARPYLNQTAKIMDEHPEFASALLALGDGHFQQEEWEETESFLASYLEQNPDSSSLPGALLKLGLALSRQGKLEKARVAYESLLEQYPNSPQHLQGMFELGQTLVEMDNSAQARELFLEIIQEGDETRFAPYALEHLGVLAMNEAAYPEAASFFARSARAAEGTELEPTVRYQQGLAWYEAGEFEQAGDCFRRVAREFPESEHAAESAARHALTLARRKQDEEAVNAMQRVLQERDSGLDTDLTAALLYESAWAQRRLKQPQEAATAYRDLLSLSDDLRLVPHARMELAELEMDKERFVEAAKLLRPLVDERDRFMKVPDDLLARAAYRLGVCGYRLEQFDFAANRLEAFIHKHPDHELVPAAALLGGEGAFRAGNFKKAIVQLERAAAFRDQDGVRAPALLRLGECHAALQHWKESEQAFAEYLKHFSEEDLWFQARFGVGWARENQGDLKKAIAEYEVVVARHQGPTAARSQFQIGECLFALKKYEEAVTALLRVDMLYDAPQWSAAALYEAGRCFESMGQVMEARDQFQRVRDRHEGSEWAELAARRLRELPSAAPPGHSGQ